jgi:hypothetical protein
MVIINLDFSLGTQYYIAPNTFSDKTTNAIHLFAKKLQKLSQSECIP